MPEFSGKPDEDAEAHLLHTNDWIQMILFNTIKRSQIMVSLIRTY